MQNEPLSTGYAATGPVVASSGSAVSWGAVLAGAFVGAALSAMLMVGGSGFGLLAVSPWQNEGASGTTLAVGTIVWLLFTQIIAYGVAGYVTGRLRTRWLDTQRDEVYFRDTAHGLLVWAVSVVIGLMVLGATASSVIGGTVQAGAALGGTGAAAAISASAGSEGDDGASLDYFADALLRPQGEPRQAPSGELRQEISRLLAHGLLQGGELTQDDQAYLVQAVARHTGLDEAAAKQRVDELSARARQAVSDAEQSLREAGDTARKATATLSLWAFVSLLLGAFIASYAATVGGRTRDQ